MKDRKQKLAELLEPAIAASVGNQARWPFTRAQTIVISAMVVFFVMVEAVEMSFSMSYSKIEREAIEQAAILRVCPPLRMPAQLAQHLAATEF